MEFQSLLLALLAENNRLMGELLRMATEGQMADLVQDRSGDQQILPDGEVLRVRTPITERISAITHINNETLEIVYAAFEDVVTGERMVCKAK